MHAEPAVDDSHMEADERSAKEEETLQMLLASIMDVFGQSGEALPQIVGGEDRCTVESGGTGKSQPLDRSGKKHRIQSDDRVNIRWNQSQQNTGDHINADGNISEINPGDIFGYKSRKDDSCNITQHRTQTDRKSKEGSVQAADNQENQIGCLGRTESITSIQKCIDAEKSTCDRHAVMNNSF